MNACINPNTASTDDIDSTIATLSEEVADLLFRITGVEATRSEESGAARLVSPLTFPDNIGDGTIVGALFRYRDGVRLDLRIDHNRVFAGQDGRPAAKVFPE